MRHEAAIAIKTAEVRPNGLAASSNLISNIDFPNKARLPKTNVIQFPETAPKLTVITADHKPATIIEFPQPKPLELQPKTEKSEVSIIEEVKKTEIYHPGRKKGYLDETGRRIIWRRRGRSGCRCDGDERSSGCRSRSCRNKDKEVKPIDIRARSAGVRRGSQRIAATRRIAASQESRKTA